MNFLLIGGTCILLFIIGSVCVFSLSRFYISKQFEWNGDKKDIDLPNFSIDNLHTTNAILVFLIALLLTIFNYVQDRQIRTYKEFRKNQIEKLKEDIEFRREIKDEMYKDLLDQHQ